MFLANQQQPKHFVNAAIITFERGTFITNKVKLSKDWRWDRKTVSKFLKALEEDGKITYKSDNKGTIISIANITDYLGDNNQLLKHHPQQNPQQKDNKIPSSSPSACQQNELPFPGNNTTEASSSKTDLSNKSVAPSSKRKRKSKAFVPPTEEEVIKYFVDNGYRKDVAVHVYKYYTDGNWHDSKGNPVINWKQKARGVWFKEANRIQNLDNTTISTNDFIIPENDVRTLTYEEQIENCRRGLYRKNDLTLKEQK